MLGGGLAENTVQRIAETAGQTVQKSFPADGQIAGKGSGDAAAADKGEDQGHDFFFCEFFVEQDHGHQHHKHRRRIKQQGRDSQAAACDGVEVTPVEKDQSDYAVAEKHPPVFGADKKLAYVRTPDDQGGKQQGGGHAQGGDLQRGKAFGRQKVDKEADQAPKGSGACYGKSRRVFHGRERPLN